MESLRISVEKDTLEILVRIAEAGVYPKVEYLPDGDRVMLDEAYEIRGDALMEIFKALKNILE
jgi:hypothetical protein